MSIAIGVTDDGTARTIWLLDDGTETADTCEVCEVPFAKRRANHVTCGKLGCQRRHEAKARGGVVRADLAPIPCASCKVPFRPTRKGGVTCGAKTCKSRRHDARGAERERGRPCH